MCAATLSELSPNVERQVEISRSTSYLDDQDTDDSENEAEGTIVVSPSETLPHFGNVSTVNSSDVHFGNKTVYQGPVTIKQFLHPNSVKGLAGCVNVPSAKLDLHSTTSGVDNPGYVKDSCVNKDDNVARDDGARNGQWQYGKGTKWIKNLGPREIVIIVSVIIASVTILSAIILWRHSVPQNDISLQEEPYDNIPVDYQSDSNSTINERVRIFPRLHWLAQPPVQQPNKLETPVGLVIIQHTATENCFSRSKCKFQVRHIQEFHIESNRWWDIGYNFLVGGDGDAYEGRGWTEEGAHTFGYNDKSIGIAFIGTFTAEAPPPNQINAFNKVVEKGVERGYIKKDYKIIAARQLAATESPGAAFYKEIQTWPHWAEKP